MITWRIVHFLFTPLPPKDERTCRKALPSVFQEGLAFRTLVNKINASCENNPDLSKGLIRLRGRATLQLLNP